jgi:hypothetical protein
MGSHQNRWTNQQIQFLTDNWATMELKELVNRLQHSEIAVITKRYELGLPDNTSRLLLERIRKNQGFLWIERDKI